MPDQSSSSISSRREFVRRGAIVGGTLLWATPVVQSIPTPAFAQGSPLDGGGGPDPISGFSYFAATVSCTEADGTVTWYRVKYEVNDSGGGTWEEDPGALPACRTSTPSLVPVNWDADATVSIAGDAAPLNITVSQSGKLVSFTLNPTDRDCTFGFEAGVNGVIKEALNCATGGISADGQTLTFDTSLTDP